MDWADVPLNWRRDVIQQLTDQADEARREHKEVPGEMLDMLADALDAAAARLKGP